ncbi:MAG: 16S rRNA (cytosine(967)-C(5))-methyltransferase [Cyanobium sp.]
MPEPVRSNGLPAREVAWKVLLAVAAGAYADAALERELKRQSLSGADRALATELAYGSIRQRRLLDAWLDAHGRVRAEQQPPRLRWLLHVGLYQLLFTARIPASAAVSTTVDLAKQGGLARLAPVANGLLRSVLRRREQVGAAASCGPLAAASGTSARSATAAQPWLGLPLSEDPCVSFGLRQSLPEWLAADLLGWLGLDRAESFARACNSSPPLDLRVNRRRSDRQALVAAFAAAGLRSQPLAESADGLTLLDRSGDLRSLPGYGEGLWSVQDRSAQRIVPLLDPQPGQKVLDACAAPGGKCTQIAEWMADQGEIWAVDRSEARLRRVALNAERLGLTSIQRLSADASDLAGLRPEWIGSFDRILLDAPCSGLGTLSRHADARWRMQEQEIDTLVALQRQLLEGLLPLLAPAGRLVYATCTVHPRENTEMIAWLLQRQPQLRLQQQEQWWPAQELDGSCCGDGFFVAVLDLQEAGFKPQELREAAVAAPLAAAG